MCKPYCLAVLCVVLQVRKPAVGEFKPAAVTADIVIDTRNLRGNIRAEWDELKLHDVLFLLTIRCKKKKRVCCAATSPCHEACRS